VIGSGWDVGELQVACMAGLDAVAIGHAYRYGASVQSAVDVGAGGLEIVASGASIRYGILR
jgi:hypothetical protein